MNSVSDPLGIDTGGPVAVTRATLHRLWGGLLILLLAAAGFYSLQNTGVLPGGDVAGAKVLWLLFALYYWFIVPLVLALDARVSVTLRRAWRIFFINMALRAVIELWMMYVSLNWHPYYGIAHDVFSIVLITVLLLAHAREGRAARLLFYILPVMGLMFMVEIGFVFYLLERVATHGEAVYYVPAGEEHRSVLTVTWGMVIVLALYTLWLLRRGIRAS